MFRLPDLLFPPDALSPWTSAETLSFHHGKHHAGYVKKLNDALVGTAHEGKSLEELIAVTRGAEPGIFNNAAQHFNHSFFWECLSAESSAPEGELADAIARDFGSFEDFKKKFSETALKHFGSGWAWLVKTPEGTLAIKDFHDAETPAGTDDTPLLTLDVWEHAYYLDHRNDRAKFIEGFWAHVDWKHAASRLMEKTGA